MSGPIPPETNPTPEPQYFQPSNFNISALTRGATTTVTTSVDNNFVVGQQVRFHIAPGYGIPQLNNQAALVSVINSTTQFVANIDTSRYYDPYVASPGLPYSYQNSQVSAIGDQNFSSLGYTTPLSGGTQSAANLTVLGAFQNISPN